MRPILYLDVEGTLLLIGAGTVHFRPHLAELFAAISALSPRMECRWLTSYSSSQLERIFAVEGVDIATIGYQPWEGCKASALSRSNSVLWVDDHLSTKDAIVLQSMAAEGCRVTHRAIPRWNGDPEDRALLDLRRDLEGWIGNQTGFGSTHRGEMVA